MNSLTRSTLLALGLALLLAGCATTTPPPGSPPPGPRLPATPVALSSGGASFVLENRAGAALAWSLTAIPDPGNPQPGAWLAVRPERGVLAPGERTTVGLTLLPDLRPGRYGALLRLDTERGSQSLRVSAEVEGPPSPPPSGGFQLSGDGLPTSLQPGFAVTLRLSIERTGGFGGAVTLSLEGAPPGLAGTFSPQPAAGDGTDLTLSSDATVAPGSYELTIRGRSGELQASTTLAITVAGSSALTSVSGQVVTANAGIPAVPGATSSVLSPAARAQAGAGGSPAPYMAGQLLVAYRLPDAVTNAERTRLRPEIGQAVAQRFGLSVLQSGSGREPDLVQLPAGADPVAWAGAIGADPQVRYAEPNALFHVQSGAVPPPLNDPDLARLWHLPLVGAPLAWQANGGSSVVVAVIDTGIDLDHEDLRGTFVGGGIDLCPEPGCGGSDADPRPAGPADTHGTHVTGLLAAAGGNGRGVAGVLAGAAAVLPVKIFPAGEASATTAAALADAIRWAAGETVRGIPNPHPARIINLSLGAAVDSRTVREAVAAAQARGALLVAAAGNGGSDGAAYPARYPGVLGVGAVGSDLRRTCFSNGGAGLDLMAPGGNGYASLAGCSGAPAEALYSTLPGGYGLNVGTSMATPLVSAGAALLWQALPGATAAAVHSALLASAYFDPNTMDAYGYGAGLLRLDAALGFPGPGDAVTVRASPGGGRTVVLDPRGGSSPFLLDGLGAGAVRLEAAAEGFSRPLRAVLDLTLGDGERRTGVILPLTP